MRQSSPESLRFVLLVLTPVNPAQCVTHTCDRKLSFESVMNVTLAHTEGVVSSAVHQVRASFSIYARSMLICATPGISDAYYCAECTRLEKDRDGCPKIVNLGASRTDLFYERRRLGTSILPNKLRKREETENSNYQGLRRVSGITIPSLQYISRPWKA